MSEQPNYEQPELELLRQHLFGKRSDDSDSDSDSDSDNDGVGHGLYIPSEGTNPPARVDDRMRMRDWARRFFDPYYAATEPELPADEAAK